MQIPADILAQSRRVAATLNLRDTHKLALGRIERHKVSRELRPTPGARR
jgi:hypothetical protein